MVRAAIVGLGRWARTIVDAVQGKSDQITFVAGNTRTRSKAEDYAREKNIQLRDKLDDILGDSSIEAIVFTTPHSMHEEHIKSAAKAGKHIFVEKPFTLKVAGAKAALNAVKKAGVVIAIDYQRRFHPSVGEIRNRIKDGRLGTPCFGVCEVTVAGGLFMPKESWRTNPKETPVGAMTGLGVHAVDCFIDLFGPVEKVYCVNARRAAPLVDDTTNVMMTHKNGAISNLLCTLSSAVHYRIAVYGSRGLAETEKLSFDTLRIIPAPDKPPSGAHQTAEPQIIENKGFSQVRAALEAFAGAVRGKAPFPITPDQILHGVAVFEAIEKSAKSGKPAKVG